MPDYSPDDIELRRAARERALELLYESEIKGVAVDDLLVALPLQPADLTLELVRGVEARLPTLDAELQRRVEPRWSMRRLAAVDRAILRLGTYELLFETGRTPAIVLNEAVVLARRFGTDASPRFVNGVLAAVAEDAKGEVGSETSSEPEVGLVAVTEDAAGEPVRHVDGVIMDLDGVIRHWDDQGLAEAEAELGLPAGAIGEVAFEADLLGRSMRGQLTADEWYQEIGEVVGAKHGVDAAAVEQIAADVGWSIDESVMELVDLIRQEVPVVLLSNASSRLFEDLELSGIADRFDAVVSSAVLGVTKPDAAAYRAAADAIEVPLERCLMVDDRAENVDGAEAAGARVALFTSADALAEELERAGVLDLAS